MVIFITVTNHVRGADLRGLLGAAIQPHKQSGNDAVHSASCPTLEKDAESLSSRLQHTNSDMVTQSRIPASKAKLSVEHDRVQTMLADRKHVKL